MKLSIKRKNLLCTFLKEKTDEYKKEFDKKNFVEKKSNCEKSIRIAKIINEYEENLGCCKDAVVELMEELTGKPIVLSKKIDYVPVPLVLLSCVVDIGDNNTYIITNNVDNRFDIDGDCCDFDGFDIDGDCCDLDDEPVRPASRQEILAFIDKCDENHMILNLILAARNI